MEIILKEDIIGLGFKNDIVTVKNGYGRNYLIPKGLGIVATPSQKKVLAENLKQQSRKLAAIKDSADKKAATLEGISVEIPMKVSANGVTYGSVNAAMVAAELQKKGFDIDRKIVTMHDAKAIGDYVALVHLHKEVIVEIPVKVIEETQDKKASNKEQEEASKETIKAEDATTNEEQALQEALQEATQVEETQEEQVEKQETQALQEVTQVEEAQEESAQETQEQKEEEIQTQE